MRKNAAAAARARRAAPSGGALGLEDVPHAAMARTNATGMTRMARSLAGAAAPASAADRYTARGRVIALHAKEIEINTERIPAFKAVDGKVSPMEAMPMGYVIGDGVARDGLAVGDPIQLTFEVRWADANPLRLTQVVKLPADTQLALP